jgi:polysaccharide biosynthesis protein PslG
MLRKILRQNRNLTILAAVVVGIGISVPVYGNLSGSIATIANKTNALRAQSRLASPGANNKSKNIRKNTSNRKQKPVKTRTNIKKRSSHSIFSTPIRVSEAFGLNYSFPNPHPKPGELEMLAETGVRWIRVSMSWGYIERNKGQYDFAAYDKIFNDFAKYNLRPLVSLDSNGQKNYPNNANKYPYPPDTPEAQEAFSKWATAVIDRYKGRGIIWEMYNEPNNAAFWPPAVSVQDYNQLALIVGKAVKQTIPNEILIGPSLLHSDYAFLEENLKAGALSYWNGISVHLYRHSKSPETASADYATFNKLIQKYNTTGAHIPIISSEWGYPNYTWNGVPYNEDKKARFLARQWLSNLANNIPVSIWFEWKEPAQSGSFNSGGFGLVGNTYHAGRTAVYDAKPAFYAAKTLTTSLKDYAFSRRLYVNSSVDHVLEFNNVVQGRSVKAYAVWRDSSQSARLNLPITSGRFNVISHLGKNLGTISAGTQGTSIELSASPKYLIPVP